MLKQFQNSKSHQHQMIAVLSSSLFGTNCPTIYLLVPLKYLSTIRSVVWLTNVKNLKLFFFLHLIRKSVAFLVVDSKHFELWKKQTKKI